MNNFRLQEDEIAFMVYLINYYHDNEFKFHEAVKDSSEVTKKIKLCVSLITSGLNETFYIIFNDDIINFLEYGNPNLNV